MSMISVIVPVYKVEPYLRQCVDSILAQTYTDFELILVDDGSPDNCGAICDEYATKDSRIRVIHQENGGLSAARNAGLDAAAGEYITFVDSDDVIAPDCLHCMIDIALQTKVDIVSGKMAKFSNENAELWGDKPTEYEYFTEDRHAASVRLYRDSSRLPINACGKLYRSDLLKHLRFPLGRLHEDQAFVPKAVYAANEVAMVDRALYGYREREASITQSTFTNRRYDDIWAIDGCVDYFSAKGETEIAAAAEKKRTVILAKYALLARNAGVTPPEEYRVRLLKALRCLRKNVSTERFEWYLSMVHPKLPTIFEYAMWLKRRVTHG